MTTPELQESTDFFEPALLIPVGGKVYSIKPLTAETVIIMQNARDAAKKASDEGKDPYEIDVEGPDEDAETTQRRVFGDAYDEMIADGVSAVGMFRMTQVIMIWTFSGFDAAKAFVTTGGKALTVPNREARRTATRTRTAAASTTRKRNSATTTSSRKATTEKAAGGTTSSATGTPSKRTSKTPA